MSRIAITGTVYRNDVRIERKYLVDMLESAGHSIDSSVTDYTEYLVVGDKGEGTKKWRMANVMGTKILWPAIFWTWVLENA